MSEIAVLERASFVYESKAAACSCVSFVCRSTSHHEIPLSPRSSVNNFINARGIFSSWTYGVWSIENFILRSLLKFTD